MKNVNNKGRPALVSVPKPQSAYQLNLDWGSSPIDNPTFYGLEDLLAFPTEVGDLMWNGKKRKLYLLTRVGLNRKTDEFPRSPQ